MASSSRESLDDYAELNHRGSNPTAIMTQNLLVEIRQAVYEAQPKGSEEMNDEWGLLVFVWSGGRLCDLLYYYPLVTQEEIFIVILKFKWRSSKVKEFSFGLMVFILATQLQGGFMWRV